MPFATNHPPCAGVRRLRPTVILACTLAALPVSARSQSRDLSPSGGALAGAPGGTVPVSRLRTEARIREFTFQAAGAGPSVVMAAPDGDVWVAMARAGRLGRFHGETLREYALPPGSFPVGIALAPGGEVWYTDIRRNVVARFDPRTGTRKEYVVPTPDAWPFFLHRAPDGTVWFTERVGNKIGRLDPATGAITEYEVPTPHAQPAGLTVTPAGHVFFTENSANQIGHLDPRAGRVQEIRVPSPATPGPQYGPAGITSDVSGNVWFAELDGRLARIRSGTLAIEEFPLPQRGTRPAGVAVDRWGLVWFTELDGNSVSSFDPVLRVFRRHPLPTGAPDPRPLGPPEATARGEMPTEGGPRARTSRPFGIAVDTEDRVWFSEQYAHKAGMLALPEVELVLPAEAVRSSRLSIHLRVRGAAPAQPLRYLLDGDPISVTGAEVALSMVPPGCHVLAVQARRANGEVVEANAAFVLEPSLELIAAAVESLGPDALPTELNGRLSGQWSRAQLAFLAGNTPAGRAVLREIEETLGAVPGPSGVTKALLQHLRAFDIFAEREFPVALGNGPTAPAPAALVVEVGDRVRWRNETGQPLTIRSPDGEIRAPEIPPGGSWTHVFAREGRHAYAVPGKGVAGSVEVRARTTAIREVPMLGPNRVPGVLAFDRAGNLWFTAGGGGFSRLADVPLGNRIGRLAPDGILTEFETPTPESAPTSLKVADDGGVWFTERSGNHIGRLDPSTGRIREYPIPTPVSGATGIALDAQGGVWFTSKKASRIGRLDPATGEIREFATPDTAALPSTVTVDHHGFVWFDERGTDKFVRLDPATGRMTEYTVPTAGSRVVGLLPDPRGFLWFLELGGHKIGRLDVSSGQIVEYAIPTALATPFKATLDAYGRVWFTEVFGNKIGVLDDGRFHEFAVPTAESMPGGIAVDESGSLWFSEQAGNQLGVLSGATRFLRHGSDPAVAAGGSCTVPAGRVLPGAAHTFSTSG